MKDLIVGTAGHIDHGKTALVRALTGIDTDRLEEEKRRGITIDIGFAHTEIGDYRIGFIDVPGHEKFVKNMLSGIGGIQFLLLVVAADESIMPQTVEHFQICRLLEIQSGIIVISKKNQVDPDLLEVVREEVRELAAGSFLETAPVLPVDSLSGEGISELKEALRNQIEILDKADRLSIPLGSLFRLPIDRVFTVKGFGTVVTGTPQGGEIQQDDNIAVYPGGQTGKVRGIQVFGKKTEKASAGQRTALNLSGIEKETLERGIILGEPGMLKVSQQLDVQLRLLENAPRALRNRDPIRFHHGSGEIMGRVYLKPNQKLKPGQESPAQLRLESPTVCLPGDHFVLRRYSPLTTIGGGIVLDIAPRRWRKKHLDEHLTLLNRIKTALTASGGPKHETLVEHHVRQRGITGTDLRDLGSLTGLTKAKLQATLRQLESILQIPTEPPVFVAEGVVEAIKEKVCNYLDRYHEAKPLSSGCPREELRERFLPGDTGNLFQFVLEKWQEAGEIDIRGSVVARQGRAVKLSEEQETTRARLLEAIARSNLITPTLDELATQVGGDPDLVRNVFFYLLEAREIWRISGNMVLLPSQFVFLRDRLRNRFPSGSVFTVSEFKDLFSVSRKYAIPLLELLDREKVTRRTGNKRMVI